MQQEYIENEEKHRWDTVPHSEGYNMSKNKKKKLVFKHTETNLQNITTVQIDEDGEKALEELKKKYEKRGIPVKVEDDQCKEQEFIDLDFKTLTDGAGDPVLHFKMKAKNLILYLTTPHPDSLNCLQTLKNSIRGFAFEIEIRDYMVDIKDMLRNIQQQQKGQVKVEDGIHPNMKQYLKDDFKS